MPTTVTSPQAVFCAKSCGCSLSQYSGLCHCSHARMHHSEPGRPPSPWSCPSAASRSQGNRCHWPLPGCRYMKKFLVHLHACMRGGCRSAAARTPASLHSTSHPCRRATHLSMLLSTACAAISLITSGSSSASNTKRERGTGPPPARPWASAASSLKSSFSEGGSSRTAPAAAGLE